MNEAIIHPPSDFVPPFFESVLWTSPYQLYHTAASTTRTDTHSQPTPLHCRSMTEPWNPPPAHCMPFAPQADMSWGDDVRWAGTASCRRLAWLPLGCRWAAAGLPLGYPWASVGLPLNKKQDDVGDIPITPSCRLSSQGPQTPKLKLSGQQRMQMLGESYRILRHDAFGEQSLVEQYAGHIGNERIVVAGVDLLHHRVVNVDFKQRG